MNPSRPSSSLAVLTLGALGVVYGDIGTSPLYTVKEVFAPGHVPLTPDNIFGVLSLMFWSITVIVSIKYVVLILGTAIFFGDGVITPAVSVLGAMEGLEVAAPALKQYIVPLSLVVLTGLFMVQRHGTGGIGKFFGPITALWFIVIAVLGVVQIAAWPSVLGAFSPHHALRFAWTQPSITFVALGFTVLCVTGAEALYADMGHFGKRPIRIAWFALAMPALVLNYFGQGAMLLRDPSKAGNPFFEMAPDWALYPLIALATAAAVIASQALISAAFSITKQAIQLGYMPRLRILHTSVRETGQVYVPFVNWALYVCIVGAVVGFGSSGRLASAYGITVTIDMTITTVMTFFVIRFGWKYPWALSVAATVFFFAVDLVYLSANAVKVLEGGWFPLVIGAVMFMLMMTWKEGRGLMSTRLREDAIDLHSFLEAVFLSPPTRVAGTAVFLVSDQGVTPNAMLHNLKHNKVLHETNLFVTVKQHEVPWINFSKRCEIEPLGNNCWQVTLNFGFKNEPDVPEALALLRQRGCVIDDMDTSYFLSRDIVSPSLGSGMAPWREKLFAGMHRNASAAADFLRLPANRVVELGSKLEI